MNAWLLNFVTMQNHLASTARICQHLYRWATLMCLDQMIEHMKFSHQPFTPFILLGHLLSQDLHRQAIVPEGLLQARVAIAFFQPPHDLLATSAAARSALRFARSCRRANLARPRASFSALLTRNRFAEASILLACADRSSACLKPRRKHLTQSIVSQWLHLTRGKHTLKVPAPSKQ